MRALIGFGLGLMVGVFVGAAVGNARFVASEAQAATGKPVSMWGLLSAKELWSDAGRAWEAWRRARA